MLGVLIIVLTPSHPPLILLYSLSIKTPQVGIELRKGVRYACITYIQLLFNLMADPHPKSTS